MFLISVNEKIFSFFWAEYSQRNNELFSHMKDYMSMFKYVCIYELKQSYSCMSSYLDQKLSCISLGTARWEPE